MGDGSKVKLGICDVTYKNVALGYTKGGVNLTVETQTHEITVDQEGIAPVAAIILGRKCTCEVPMAETDYERLSGLMPASVFENGKLSIASGMGSDLMDYAGLLTLHPHALPKANKQFDINVLKAAPTANIKLTMTTDGEWIYPINFIGFVDADTGYILTFGDGS